MVHQYQDAKDTSQTRNGNLPKTADHYIMVHCHFHQSNPHFLEDNYQLGIQEWEVQLLAPMMSMECCHHSQVILKMRKTDILLSNANETANIFAPNWMTMTAMIVGWILLKKLRTNFYD